MIVHTNRCPFCHDDIRVEEDAWSACARCFARHHDACWGESGACGSCGGDQRLAPVSEAKTEGLRQKSEVEELGALTSEAGPRGPSPLLLLGVLIPLLFVAVGITLLALGQGEIGIPILFGLLGVALLAGTPLALAYLTARQRRKDEEAAQEVAEEVQAGARSFTVRYCSEKRFRSWWKLYAWEATGALSVGPEGVTLRTRTAGGWIERRFHPEDATVEWKGRNLWPNGGCSWFVIEQDGEQVYFSAVTPTVHTSSASTRAIYEAVVAG